MLSNTQYNFQLSVLPWFFCSEKCMTTTTTREKHMCEICFNKVSGLLDWKMRCGAPRTKVSDKTKRPSHGWWIKILTDKNVYPLNITGVNYFCPFEVTRKARTRRAVVLFFFRKLVSRGAHTKLGTGLDTDAFLVAITMLLCRHGTSHRRISDNGTHFFGSCSSVQKMLRWVKLRRRLRAIGTLTGHMKTQIPGTPPLIGFWGRLVRGWNRGVVAILEIRRLT